MKFLIIATPGFSECLLFVFFTLFSLETLLNDFQIDFELSLALDCLKDIHNCLSMDRWSGMCIMAAFRKECSIWVLRFEAIEDLGFSLLFFVSREVFAPEMILIFFISFGLNS